LSDLRYGVRILSRSPAFSAAAVFLIALGIGGNTAIYSMINGLLSKPAPGVQADRLVVFGTSLFGRGGDPGENSYPSFLYYAAQNRTMQSLTASRFARFTFGLPDGTWQLRGLAVSGGYIQTAGLHLAKGRDFTAGEARGAAPLANTLRDQEVTRTWSGGIEAKPAKRIGLRLSGNFDRSSGVGAISGEPPAYGPVVFPLITGTFSYNFPVAGQLSIDLQRTYYDEQIVTVNNFSANLLTIRWTKGF
jgi:hypothetical protein